jgi:hypothetical protein
MAKQRAARKQATTDAPASTRTSTANPQVQEKQALNQQRANQTADQTQQAIDTVSRPPSQASPRPETQSATTSTTLSPADVPAEAQPKVVAIQDQRALDDETREQELTPTQRIDRIEMALGVGHGLNVRNFTDLAVGNERDQAIAEAVVKAADVLRQAVIDAHEDLTLKERISRAEQALKATSLGNLL